MNNNGNDQKRYYWLKLRSTYFNQLEQKKMKKQDDGKDMQIVYLRMMLLSIDRGGYIYFQGVYDTLEEELAEEFDEPLEIIKKTLDYLKQNNMVAVDDNHDCFIPEALEHTGSEGYSAERMRKMRKNRKVSQCDIDVTVSDEEKEKEKELELQKELQKEGISSEPDKPTPNPSGILLPLNDKTYYDVPLDKIGLWEEVYPAVEVRAELRRMVAWLDSNPTKRKTRRGVERFINSWLARTQDSGGSKGRETDTLQQSSGTTEPYSMQAHYNEMYRKLRRSEGEEDIFS